MSEWISVEDRLPPKDKLFLALWSNEVPVFACWMEAIKDDEAGYRVATWSPRLGWGLNGNCSTFSPKLWVEIPEIPEPPK